MIRHEFTGEYEDSRGNLYATLDEYEQKFFDDCDREHEAMRDEN